MVQPIMHEIYRRRHILALGILLVMASFISVVLEWVHEQYNGSSYGGLVLNLFLAWIPFGAAVLAYLTRHNKITFFLIMPFCTLIWLIFFPNAPYLLTDFNQLALNDSRVPVWFDVILLIWFAWTGLLLGIASLYLIQVIITEVTTPFIGWVSAIFFTVLSSVGVYLGRFLRWNSWDLIQDPVPIARELYGIVRNPFSNIPDYVFMILFTLLFLFIYVTFHLFGGMMQERSERMGRG